MKFLIIILSTLSAISPLPASAHDDALRPGTDDYLRQELGLTDEQLAVGMPTEDREPFESVTGEAFIDDPLGDVLDRVGRTTTVQQPWGDIGHASIERKEGDGVWEIEVTLGGDLPVKPSGRAVFHAYADADGVPDNNAPNEGVRGGMDAEFTLEHNPDNGWYTDFRWYNPEPTAQTWGINKETAMRFRIKGSVITLSIPFSEVPAKEPAWRLVMGVSDGSRTEIDVAPGIGFPPAKGTARPWYRPLIAWYESAKPADIILGAALLLSTAYLAWKRRK
ncbi:hypothetical protein EPO34_04050 [Patescibacteria group bacterium]|nr:MAG: hypothetical protein EPO34_04050 [Patescibacteria group bacterium]